MSPGVQLPFRLLAALALAAVGLAFPAAAQENLPPDRFANRVEELRGKVPSGSPELDREVGAELLFIALRLEPLVGDGRDAIAAWSYAYALSALAGLDPELRGGMSEDECLDRARAAARWIRPADRAVLELEIARTLHGNGRMGAALALLSSALDELDDVSWPWARLLVADIDRLRGEPEQALLGIDEASARLRDDVPFHRLLLPFALGLRGLVYLELGVIDEAGRWFAREEELAAERGDVRLARVALIHRTALLLANYREDAIARETRQALERELELSASPEVRAALLSIHARVLGDRALGLGRELAPALVALEAALAEPGLGAEDEIATRIALARVLVGAGRGGEARRELDAAERRERELTEGLDSRGRVRDRGQIAATRAQLAIAEGRTGAELAPHTDELEPVFEAFLEQWRRTPRREGGIGFLHFHERLLVLDALIRAHVIRSPGQAGARAALDRVLRAQALGTLSRDLGLSAGTVDAVQDALGDREGVLVVLPSLERTHLFALDRRHLVHVELASSLLLEDRRREFQALVETPPALRGPSDELERLGRELAVELFPPAVRRLLFGWDAVTIVGSSFLADLPFEALPFGSSLFGLELAVGHVPSLALDLHLRARARERTLGAPSLAGEILVACAPDAGTAARERWPHLEPLPLGASELTELGGDALLLPATPRALEARLRESARVLHLVAHGVYDPTRERPAGLALAPEVEADDDGLVFCERVETWRAPPLVVLSACGAARGPARIGDDGVANLGGALLRAGAEAVVLSRADQELVSTMLLGRALHEALRRGESTASALRLARRRVADDPRFADPFHHGLVRAVGHAHAPLFPEAAGTRALGFPWAALGLALVAIDLLRRLLLGGTAASAEATGG